MIIIIENINNVVFNATSTETVLVNVDLAGEYQITVEHVIGGSNVDLTDYYTKDETVLLFAAIDHTHGISDISSLQEELDAKSGINDDIGSSGEIVRVNDVITDVIISDLPQGTKLISISRDENDYVASVQIVYNGITKTTTYTRDVDGNIISWETILN